MSLDVYYLLIPFTTKVKDKLLIRTNKQCWITNYGTFNSDIKDILHALQSQESLNGPVFVLESLNRVWKLLKIAEKSEQSLNIT